MPFEVCCFDFSLPNVSVEPVALAVGVGRVSEVHQSAADNDGVRLQRHRWELLLRKSTRNIAMGDPSLDHSDHLLHHQSFQ